MNTVTKTPGTTLITTIGYEGRSPESLIAMLASNRVETLIDVRQRASSRKRGFGKTALRKLLIDAGISYVHLPRLGTPAELRQQLRDGAIELTAYLELYRQHAETQDAALAELEKLIESYRCCLFCLEADYRQCHRSVLAQLLVDRSGGALAVSHL